MVAAALRGEVPASRAVAAAGNDHTAVVAVLDEETDGSELWLVDADGGRKVVLDAAFPPGWVVRAVTWTGSDFVAVGAASADDSTTSIEGAVAAIWTSADGARWDRIDLKGANVGSMLLAVAGADGDVVAGGEVRNATSDALLVGRTDGEWHRVEAPGLAEDQDEIVVGVLATAAGWHVRGRVTPPECAVSGCITRTIRIWTAERGGEWSFRDSEIEGPFPFASSDGLIYGVESDAEGAYTLVVSNDGSNWAEATDGFLVPGVNVTAWGRSALGFLIAGTDESGQVAIWEWK